MAALWFVTKLMLISAGIAGLIHYAAPLVQWSPTLPLVLGMVLLPTVGMAIALWWRDRHRVDAEP